MFVSELVAFTDSFGYSQIKHIIQYFHPCELGNVINPGRSKETCIQLNADPVAKSTNEM